MVVMAIDPNVQVALVTIVSTAITTAGVIFAAIVNSRKEKSKAATAGVESGLDEKDVLKRLLQVLAEKDRLEGLYNETKVDLEKAREDLAEARKEIRSLRAKLKESEKDDGEPTDK